MKKKGEEGNNENNFSNYAKTPHSFLLKRHPTFIKIIIIMSYVNQPINC